MSQEFKHLPDSELELMQAIWQCEPPVTRAELEEKLTPGRKLAPTTILTFLTRLCEKGFLSVERRGKINGYTPLVSEKEYLAQESRNVLNRLYGGSLRALATALVDSGISREELEQLRQMLEEGTL